MLVSFDKYFISKIKILEQKEKFCFKKKVNLFSFERHKREFNLLITYQIHYLETLFVLLIKANAALDLVSRFNVFIMKELASIILFISTFVLIPKEFNKYKTSSVATFPDAPEAYGQPFKNKINCN
jgi:hypothetical protein